MFCHLFFWGELLLSQCLYFLQQIFSLKSHPFIGSAVERIFQLINKAEQAFSGDIFFQIMQADYSLILKMQTGPEKACSALLMSWKILSTALPMKGWLFKLKIC